VNLTRLEKAQESFSQIKLLDEEIIKVEKFANIIASGESEVDFSLIIKKESPQEKEKVLDAHGDLINEYVQIGYSLYDGLISRTGKAEQKDTIKRSVSDVSALQILGVVLFDLNTKRDYHLRRLKRLGIDI
jgi:hypothetical protein